MLINFLMKVSLLCQLNSFQYDLYQKKKKNIEI